MTTDATASGIAFSTAWAMPSRWTFSIKPIAAFLDRWLPTDGAIVDPFAGQSTRATHRNDLAAGGVDAEDYCRALIAERGTGWADAVIFDPPYSPRQISECYASIGKKATTADTQNAALYRRVRAPLADLLKPDGIALSFGWNSAGFGKAFETLEVLLVQHGGAHNDTICVAQRKATASERSGDGKR